MVTCRKLPPLEQLNALFNVRDGNLYYKSSSGRVTKNSLAGWTDDKGYRKVEIEGLQYLVHRLIWKMHYGKDPDDTIDHIDRDPSNNSIDNLRVVSHSVNMHNRRAKGYYYNKPSRKYQAYLRVNKKMKSLGYFDTEEEARAAYVAAKALFMASVDEGKE